MAFAMTSRCFSAAAPTSAAELGIAVVDPEMPRLVELEGFIRIPRLRRTAARDGRIGKGGGMTAENDNGQDAHEGE